MGGTLELGATILRVTDTLNAVGGRGGDGGDFSLGDAGNGGVGGTIVLAPGRIFLGNLTASAVSGGSAGSPTGSQFLRGSQGSNGANGTISPQP